MLQWIKEHFESLLIGAFGFGGIYVQHRTYGDDIKELKTKQEMYHDDIGEIKGILQRLDERTKHL